MKDEGKVSLLSFCVFVCVFFFMRIARILRKTAQFILRAIQQELLALQTK